MTAELDHAISEARRIRRLFVRRTKDTDMGGMCAIASVELALALGSTRSLRITACSYQRHVWNVVDGVIIDITATQFNCFGSDLAGFRPVRGVLVTRKPLTYHQPVLAYGRRAAALIVEIMTCSDCGDADCARAQTIAREMLRLEPRRAQDRGS